MRPGPVEISSAGRGFALGDYDLDSIDIIGELRILPDFKFPPPGGEAIMNNDVIQGAIHDRILLRPKLFHQGVLIIMRSPRELFIMEFPNRRCRLPHLPRIIFSAQPVACRPFVF